jgi:hypothetical protein
MLVDPRNTIEFDFALDEALRARIAAEGADAAAVRDCKGEIQRVSLAEKLLVLALAKLFNYIPEAGIWMNTQRPEWNDANNALVGNGVSMVTLYYLRRYLLFCRTIFAHAGTPAVELSSEVAQAFVKVTQALKRHLPLLNGPISDYDRKSVLDDLGRAGSSYRATIYALKFSGERKEITFDQLRAFCDLSLRHITHAIRANRRDDGLYHSYNVVQFDEEVITVGRLNVMLEGQVAVLSSGVLSAQEAADLLDALRAGPLYRADQDSYTLYPDHQLPLFFEKNDVPEEAVERSRLLSELLRRGDTRIVARDVAGHLHFNAAFRNADILRGAIDGLRGTDLGDIAAVECADILDIYERIFDHRSFTGRSGTFYKYEGLGSIYWHMVAKLLLAVQEVLEQALDAGEDSAVIERLKEHYARIREGIGVHKSPELYGAVPTDPYSHTPGFAGAQQPGMTGQVKEDIITRQGELGVTVSSGCLRFQPGLVNRSEFLVSPAAFRFYDVDGNSQEITLNEGNLAYTLCQIPVVEHFAGPQHIKITVADRSTRVVDGLTLDAVASAGIFERTGEIRRLDVFFALER